MQKYDLIVIGSGSANIVIDQALTKGLKCAMIENSKFGGTCLTRGCIPTKVMVSVADFVRHAEHIQKIGINIPEIEIEFDEMKDRVWEKINESKDVYEYYKNQENLTLYEGSAKFISDKIIKIVYNDSKKEDIITADKIVIGAGARTNIPNIDGLEDTGYITSEKFFKDEFPEKPYESLTIIGGGYIGIEFAHIFSALGTKVNVIQHNKNILPREDEEISIKALEILKSYDINIFTSKDVLKVYKDEDGTKFVQYKDIKTGKTGTASSEEILVAPGVVSNADQLDIKNTSVLLDKRGYIRTNEFLETSVPGIYAVGDINGKYQFRHKANYEAEILSHNLFFSENKDYRFARYDVIPAVAYIYPQVAHVGLTEKEARDQNYDIEIAKKFYSQTAKGFALGYSAGDILDGFTKIIVEKSTKKILGVHIIGEEASILIQPYVELMNSGEKVISIEEKDIQSELTKKLREENYKVNLDANTLNLTDNTMVAHPSLSEVSLWTKYMDFR